MKLPRSKVTSVLKKTLKIAIPLSATLAGAWYFYKYGKSQLKKIKLTEKVFHTHERLISKIENTSLPEDVLQNIIILEEKTPDDFFQSSLSELENMVPLYKEAIQKIKFQELRRDKEIVKNKKENAKKLDRKIQKIKHDLSFATKLFESKQSLKLNVKDIENLESEILNSFSRLEEDDQEKLQDNFDMILKQLEKYKELIRPFIEKSKIFEEINSNFIEEKFKIEKDLTKIQKLIESIKSRIVWIEEAFTPVSDLISEEDSDKIFNYLQKLYEYLPTD